MEDIPVRPEVKWTLERRLSPRNCGIARVSDGKFYAVTSEFCMNTGYSETEIIGSNPVELQLMDNNDFSCFTMTLLKEKFLDNFVLRMNTKSGKKILLIYSASLLEYRGESCFIFCASKVSYGKTG